MASDLKNLIRWAKGDGWRVRHTGGAHLRLDHPKANGAVYTSASPSDHRAIRNARAQMRRALKQEVR